MLAPLTAQAKEKEEKESVAEEKGAKPRTKKVSKVAEAEAPAKEEAAEESAE